MGAAYELENNIQIISNDDIMMVNSMMEYEYENTSDEDDDDYLDEIYNEDADHIENFKENNAYYIGLCYKDTHQNESIILDISISATLFLKYDYNTIYNLLGGPMVKKDKNVQIDNWLYYHKNREIELQIMKTNYKNLDKPEVEWELGVIIKTHWLRLIQRTWKRIYKERQTIIKARGNIYSISYRMLHGPWPPELNYLPGLKDMKL